MYFWMADAEPFERRARKWFTIFKNLSKNTGVACLGEILASACSFWIDLRYCLTEKWLAGFPHPRRSSHSPDRSKLLNIARSLPIVESTVPAARRLGHSQSPLVLEPKNWQPSLWIFVLPFWSFHTRKRTMSFGPQDMRVFEESRVHKNNCSSNSSCDFCLPYFDVIRATSSSWIRLSMVSRLSFICFAAEPFLLSLGSASCAIPQRWQNAAQSSLG